MQRQQLKRHGKQIVFVFMDACSRPGQDDTSLSSRETVSLICNAYVRPGGDYGTLQTGQPQVERERESRPHSPGTLSNPKTCQVDSVEAICFKANVDIAASEKYGTKRLSDCALQRTAMDWRFLRKYHCSLLKCQTGWLREARANTVWLTHSCAACICCNECIHCYIYL